MSLRSLLGGIVASAPVPYVSRHGGGIINFGHTGPKDRAGQIELYDSVGTLHGIVSKLASTTSMVDWKLWQSSTSGKPEDRVEITRHAALDLWRKPNPFMARQEFVETVQQHSDLTGEQWWVVNRVMGIPIEMWPVRPDRMAPVPHVTKFIAGYLYTAPDGEKVPLGLDQVVFVRSPSPKDIYRGSSPLGALASDLTQDQSQAAWNAAFFRNSAQPGGVIQVPRKMTDDEWEELIRRWNSQHRGTSNAGRVAVLEESTFVPMAYTQKDMQFVETRGYTKQAILDAYGFPKFGLGDVDDVNRATATASLAMMAETLTVPRLDRIKGALNGDLLPMFGATARNLEFDYENPVPPDQETENDTLTARAGAAAALVREGWDPDDVCAAVGLPIMAFNKPEPKVVQVPPGRGDDDPAE